MTTPHALIFATAADLAPYRLNKLRYAQWLLDKEGEIRAPDTLDEYPAARFAQLIAEALEAGAIDGDARLSLTVNGDDDSSGSGYYVLVGNRGDRRSLRMTTGWSQLSLRNESAPDGQIITDYLVEVIAAANDLLGELVRYPDVEEDEEYCDECGAVDAGLLSPLHEPSCSLFARGG